MASRSCASGIAWLFVAMVSPAAWANLLVNGGFEQGQPCSVGWLMAPGTVSCMLDGTTHVMAPTKMEGDHWGSTDVQVPSFQTRTATIYQTVTVSPGLPVHLTGFLGGGTQRPAYNHFLRIHDGPDYNATVIGSIERKPYTDPDPNTPGIQWTPVDLTVTPSGDTVTVSWGFDQGTVDFTGWWIVATHVDALDLTQQQPTCTGDPTITGIHPGFGPNNGTLDGVEVTGSNFDASSQVILRRAGHADIDATGETVTDNGTKITCHLPLTGAPMGKWNVVVTKTLCNEATRSDGFIVASTSITNGSFELPTAPPSCPNSPTPQGAPTDWLQGGISTGSNHLIRDADQFVPACPRPDGDHYGSILVTAGVSFGHWRAYQYLVVKPGLPVTISGQFAGGGRTTVRLILRSGDEEAPELASQLIEDRNGCPDHTYDWVPASVTGTPTSALLTVEWRMTRQGDIAAAHADKLVITAGTPPAEICGNGIDDDGDRRTDCQDPDCASDPGCSPPPTENCTNGVDDDGDLRIDCDDPDCASVCVEICGNGIDDDHDCEVDEGCEICDNGIDDNGDTRIDCDDPTCLGDPACPQEICDNATDDDDDTLIDCSDPDCDTHPHCRHHDPFADADGDGDVDQVDFGRFQECWAGSGRAPLLSGCGFFDRDNDADIDDQDFVKFQACFSGPTVPANPACDN